MIRIPERRVIANKITTVHITSPQGLTESVMWGEGDVSSITSMKTPQAMREMEEVLERLHDPDIIGHIMQRGAYKGWAIDGVMVMATHKGVTVE
jgi:hypothetical protein